MQYLPLESGIHSVVKEVELLARHISVTFVRASFFVYDNCLQVARRRVCKCDVGANNRAGGFMEFNPGWAGLGQRSNLFRWLYGGNEDLQNIHVALKAGLSLLVSTFEQRKIPLYIQK